MNALKRWASGLAAGLFLVGWVTASAEAQTAPSVPMDLSLGAGWGALWDDETNLGRGAPLAGGVATVVGGRLRLAADVDWTRHVRDSGYLRADGDLVGVFGRATYLFRGPDAAVRPTAGAGLGLLRSTGVLTWRTTLPGPGGFPVAGPDERQAWSLTRPAFDLHGGLRIAVNDRVAFRPEGRWRATFGSAASSGIEPPLLGIQAMLHLDITFD